MLPDNLCKVVVHWVKGPPSDHIVEYNEVDQLIEALEQLHVNPGRNPYSGAKTARVKKIAAYHLTARGPYWWTTPGLETKGLEGAQILSPLLSPFREHHYKNGERIVTTE